MLKIKNISHFFFFLFSFFFLFFAITSCSSPTETPKGSLTGTVSLEGQSDFSNITVALYELAYLDTTITRINQQYPHIGVIINQHTEFDHRLQSQIKQSETLADGSFELTKIPTGTFNLVAQKADFGFKYLLEVEILEGDNLLAERTNGQRSKINNLAEVKNKNFDPSSLVFDLENRSSDLTLYQVHHLNQHDITEDWIFQTDHHYIIGSEEENSVNFVPGTNLEIQPGAVVRINPGVDLIIHGNLTAQGEENNMFWITTNDGFADNSNLKCKMENVKLDSSNDLERNDNFKSSILNFTFNRDSDLELYNSFELSEFCNIENDLITWGKWDYANTCLLNKVNNLHMQNGIIRNSMCGLKNTSVDSIFVNDVCIYNIISESLGGIHYLDNTNGKIHNNILINCEIGIKTKDDCNPEISNNYISQCELGIELLKSSSNVHNNEILDNNIGIRIAGTTSPVIENNIFDNAISIFIGGYTWYYPHSQPEIHYNNIKSTNYYYYITASNMFNISAENNFYYTVNIGEIDSKVFDKLDYPPESQNEVGLVLYEPILMELNENAGVQ